MKLRIGFVSNSSSSSFVLFPDAVNDNLPDIKATWGNNPRKIYADVYIDDRNEGGLRLPGELGKNWKGK